MWLEIQVWSHPPVAVLSLMGMDRITSGEGGKKEKSGAKPSPKGSAEKDAKGVAPLWSSWLLALSLACQQLLLRCPLMSPYWLLTSIPIPFRPFYSHQSGPETEIRSCHCPTQNPKV